MRSSRLKVTGYSPTQSDRTHTYLPRRLHHLPRRNLRLDYNNRLRHPTDNYNDLQIPPPALLPSRRLPHHFLSDQPTQRTYRPHLHRLQPASPNNVALLPPALARLAASPAAVLYASAESVEFGEQWLGYRPLRLGIRAPARYRRDDG